MQDLTTVSQSSSLTTSTQPSTSNLLQPLMTALGWKDLKPAMVAAEQADHALALELQQAYDAYGAAPNQASQQRLQMALDQVIGELQTDLSRVKKLEKQAAKRLAKPQANSSYLASVGSWLKQGAQSFFGSDDASLVERYREIAQQRLAAIAQLAQLRKGLAAQVVESQMSVEAEPIEEVISPLSRRLLQTTTSPITVSQYCYPTGACELSSLYDGIGGFVLQGEVADDLSGYSVSAVGDINDDGVADLGVGAHKASPGGRYQAGKSYVVFGSRNATAWGNGTLNLSSLMNGVRGFVLQGQGTVDQSGISVSAAGDVNGDGIADLVVGAWTANPNGRTDAGNSYVVFGSRNATAWGNGVLDLSSLMNGVRGFVLQGEAASDYSGWSVSAAGDVNGDGIADLVVGARFADPNGRADAGNSYVVFGSRNATAWGNGVLDLSSLRDGVRGFMLQGEAASDYSSWSVSAAGDMNGDGLSDLVVGANGADPSGRNDAGKIYVVFGSRNSTVWGNGTVELSAIRNGVRGFVLQGEVAGDQSGRSVSSAGDMNGDGIVDLLIGAVYADPAGRPDAGKSYVVFGSRNSTAWGNGTLDLSTLRDGVRGFVLQGEAANDQSGISVSAAGDVNGDSLSDLVVGAWAADPNGRTDAGKSYVVFGSRNSTAWGNGTLDLSSLRDGVRGFVMQGEAAGDNSGYPVSAAGDINGDGVIDLVVGAIGADPSGLALAGKSYVVFGGNAVQLWANQLEIYRGQAPLLTAQNLNATLSDNRTVNFVIASVAYGQFEFTNSPGQMITKFSQSDISAAKVRFVHDGTSNAPSYSVQVGGGIIKLLPQNATINFFGFGNRLTVHQAQTLPMDTNFLDIVSSYAANETMIRISNLQHGQFLLAPSNSSINQFSQTALLAGDILFAHDGSTVAPSYDVIVTDPSRNVSSAAEVTFYRRPVWLKNQLSLTQGDAVLLSASHIDVMEDKPAANVTFAISNLQHGQFKLLPLNNSVSQFNQQQLLAGQVLFAHDDTGLAPSYQLTLDDGYFALPPQLAAVNFTALPPVLNINRLIAFQGRTVNVKAEYLNATDPDPVLADSVVMFTISQLQHGRFTLNGTNTTVSQFSQAQIKNGQVWFTHDDSTAVPSYQVTVGNPYRNSTVSAVNVFFDKRPLLINNRLTLETGESAVLSLSNLQAVDDHTASSDLIFSISDLSHGYFSQLQAPDVVINSFLQQQVRDFELQFTHDSSSNPPSYTVTVTDASGLRSYSASANVNFKNTQAQQSGIDLQQIYASVSSVGGVALAIAGYLWWRRKTTAHRRGFELANNLRKAANLEYHDFMRFDGDVFKSKVENLLGHVDSQQKGFYKSLTLEQRKSFAVCIAEVLEQRHLVKPSGYGMGMYGWMLAFSVGWSQQLDFKKFEAQLTEIAQQAVTAWQAEENPTARWPYFSPTTKDKVNAFCCARPSRAGMFARDKIRLSRSGEGLSMTELKDSKHQVIDMPSSSQKDVLVSPTIATVSSPRFFDSSAVVVSEERFGLIEKQLNQVSEGMQYMHHGMQEMHRGIQEITSNVKTVNERLDHLEAETRPLLTGPGSSSS